MKVIIDGIEYEPVTPPNPNAKWKKLWEAGEKVQYRNRNVVTAVWKDCNPTTISCWFDNNEIDYRLAPKTITIEGEELPLPLPIGDDGYGITVNYRTYRFNKQDEADKWLSCIKKWMRGEK